MSATTKRKPAAEKAKAVRSRSGKTKDPLSVYNAKRDFQKTAEPPGKVARRKGKLQFVVQKHDATRLHYDFRLEFAGVLWSWAVPKGPTLNPAERRLAARTEDHPLDYADFEGVIPHGEYGGGPVIVWDRGTWTPDDADPGEAMKKGKLTFTLDGEKLQGRFHLVRLRTDARGKENWLLFKSKDESVAESELTVDRPESVISGRTVEEVADKPDRVWHSNKKATRVKRSRAPKVAAIEEPSADALEQIKQAVSALELGFEVSSLDKVLYPDDGILKVHLLAYYASIAQWLLPHVEGRPLTLVRCSSGIGGKCFFQKHATSAVPSVVKRIDVDPKGKEEPYMLIDSMEGLVALGQMGVLEVHTWLSRKGALEKPDELIIDVDPDAAVKFEQVVDTALEIRKRLSAIGLESFVKTTGGKGLHVVAPVTRKLDWETHKDFALHFVEQMANDEPKRYLTSMRKDLRKGRIP